MPQDILLNSDFEVYAVNGDFVVGESTYQHQALLLSVSPGEIKQYPASGVGADNFLLDENPAELVREIRSEFKQDGMKVTKVDIDINGQLDIKAEY